jgi:hypothetical protein
VKLDDIPVRAFGEWDAPMTDDAEWIDVPVGMTCMFCRAPIAEGDNGAIMPTGLVQHRECSLRAVMGGIGHLVDHAHYCGSQHGPDAGLTFRASALLVWAWWTEHRRITREDLEDLRAESRNDR